MRIITVNVNGIRAAARKGFFDWLKTQDADVVCLQETRIQAAQRKHRMFTPEQFASCIYFDAQRPGYSGVALFARKTPDRVQMGLGWDEFDAEGRWIEADFGNLTVASLYLPSGSAREDRQQFKYRCMDYLKPRLAAWARSGRDWIITGDWNIAHKEIDLKNWRANQKNSGFLPEERAWMDEVFGPMGMHDAFRRVDPRPEQYTWWSNRGRAWENNVGWRIDYQVTTAAPAENVRAAHIYKDQRFSDHAPLIMDYDSEL